MRERFGARREARWPHSIPSPPWRAARSHAALPIESMTDVSAPPPARGVFVGRERELAELRAGLSDAIAARGRLFLIAGEPGIGKTRLAAALDAAAVDAGARVCWARCWEGGGAPAFWPWTVLLRGAAHDCDTAVLGDALRGGAEAVQLAPELRERVPGLPAPAGGSLLDSEHARFPLFAAVAHVLRRIGAARPLVLLFDDLHAADHPSLLLLASVARELQDARVLLVATARDVDAQQDPERVRLLAAIARGGQRLPLAGWSAGELARFVTSACGAAPTEALVGALHRATDGNPFFVDEIVRLLLSEGHGALPADLELRIPGSIRAAVRERLSPLTGATVRVLAAAAVAGRDFDLAVVREADGTDSASTLDALGEAERAALLVRHPDTVGRYSFSHALVRETLYEDLAAADRPLWHRRIGEALERLYATDLGPQLERLAYHFAQAATTGDVDKAIDYDVRAARQAAELLAFEAAARHYQRALQVQELQVPVEEGVRLNLHLGLGEMQAAAWDIDAARNTFRAAAHSARRLLRADALARAALGFAGLGFGVPRGVVDAEIVAMLEEALRLLGDRHTALWARVAVRLAVELHFSAAERERCETLSRQAVEAARRIGDDATLAYVLNARHFAAWSTTEPAERMALADEAVRLAQQLGDPDLNLQARTWRLLDLAEIGDGIGFDRELEMYDRLVEYRRLPKYLGFALALRGLRALWLGRFDEAVARAEAGMALGERIGDRAAFMSVGAQIFFARRAQGRLAELEPMGRAAAELYPANPALRCLLALLYTDLEREVDARREYARLAGDDFATLESRNMLHPLAPVLAEVCVYLGDRHRAGVLYKSLLPFAGRVMGLGPNVLFGPAAHPLATLAALLDQWDAAVQHFEAAIAEAGRMQGPVWLAAIQYDYARCLLARGESQRAGELASAALEHARAHAMPVLAARAGALQATCGGAAQADNVRQPTRTAVSGGAGRERAAAPSKDVGRRVLRFPVKPAATAPPPTVRQGIFRRADDCWSVGFDGEVKRLPSTSGLVYLARLLQHPGRPLHALDLVAIDHVAESPDEPFEIGARGGLSREERANLSVAHAIRGALRHIAENHAELGLHLDATITTGMYCSYTPSNSPVEVRWAL